MASDEISNVLQAMNWMGRAWGDSDDNGDSGDKENESFPTSSLKSYREVLENIRNIELFFIKRGKFSLANDFFLLADKVSENSVNERSHQSTLERYFASK